MCPRQGSGQAGAPTTVCNSAQSSVPVGSCRSERISEISEDIRLSEGNRAAVSVCAFMGFCFPRAGLIPGSWFALGHTALPSSASCPLSAPHKTANGWGDFVLIG